VGPGTGTWAASQETEALEEKKRGALIQPAKSFKARKRKHAPRSCEFGQDLLGRGEKAGGAVGGGGGKFIPIWAGVGGERGFVSASKGKRA